MDPCQIVIDTNVLISALRSRRGASYRLLSLLNSGKYRTYISVPLVLEYEDAAMRLLGEVPLSEQDIGSILDNICAAGQQHRVLYLWRPLLRDPKDEMVVELAVAAACDSHIFCLFQYSAKNLLIHW